VGCGGTGSSCASFLARAGLGDLFIVDPDTIGLTDLHRQILYTESDVGHPSIKANTAKDALCRANHEPRIEALPVLFSHENAGSLVKKANLVVDCSDNFETRMLINDACLKFSVPWVHGACTGTAGLVIPFPQTAGACYRCVVDRIPGGSDSSGDKRGILGPLAGVVGCLEAAEALKLLVMPHGVRSKVIYFDSLSYTYETISVRRKKNCRACVDGVYEFLEG
jgi:adenylyltransferase/sulfurtransferase